MELQEILSTEQLVHSNADELLVYTWDSKLTLWCWKIDTKGVFHLIGTTTLSRRPLTMERAKEAAIIWEHSRIQIPMKNLFEILSDNERVIVHSDVGDKVLYTWNRHKTLQAWTIAPDTGGVGWVELNAQVLMEEPASFEEARTAARSWANS